MGSCIEMTAGIVQVGLQWLLFTMMYVGPSPPYFVYTFTLTITTILDWFCT